MKKCVGFQKFVDSERKKYCIANWEYVKCFLDDMKEWAKKEAKDCKKTSQTCFKDNDREREMWFAGWMESMNDISEVKL